jgi:flagellar FliJ protein
MKKFTFRLQTLLDLRETREKEVQGELARLVGIQNQERVRQQEIQERIDREREGFSERMRRGEFRPREALLYEKFVDVSRRAIGVAEDRIQSMEPEVNRVRQKLVEARREKRVVEKLKERKYEEYQYRVNRALARENEDINQKIHMRKVRQEDQ